MFQEILDKLEVQFTISVKSPKSDNQMFITVDKKQAVNVVHCLHDNLGFKHLVLLTAVDYIEDGNFQLTYLLNNPTLKCDIGVRTLISRENATMDSAHHLWPTIATYQRELKEMFGIDFPGSPRVDEPFILEGWEGIPPYRRDFDTKAYSDSFYHQRGERTTNDPAVHMKNKLYPNE
ncbi:MAG: NADH-quinone oxidoreductase subunit C [Bacteroidales bacterium]